MIASRVEELDTDLLEDLGISREELLVQDQTTFLGRAK
jgi:hypothetical protein